MVPGPDGDETFVLARSADCRKKEQAMHQRFLDRMEEALTKMRASIESRRLKDEAVAQRRLGRLQERSSRAAGAFEVKIATREPNVTRLPSRMASAAPLTVRGSYE